MIYVEILLLNIAEVCVLSPGPRGADWKALHLGLKAWHSLLESLVGCVFEFAPPSPSWPPPCPGCSPVRHMLPCPPGAPLSPGCSPVPGAPLTWVLPCHCGLMVICSDAADTGGTVGDFCLGFQGLRASTPSQEAAPRPSCPGETGLQKGWASAQLHDSRCAGEVVLPRLTVPSTQMHK